MHSKSKKPLKNYSLTHTKTMTKNTNETTYNGFSNFATWRINLELIDDSYISTIGDLQADPFETIADLAYSIQEYAEEALRAETSTGYVLEYALAFLADVNWYEIAQLVANEHPELIKPNTN